MSDYLTRGYPHLLKLSVRGKETKVAWDAQSEAKLPGYTKLFPGTGRGTFGIDLTPAAGGECARRARRAAQKLYELLPRTKFLVFLRNGADLYYSSSYCRNASDFDRLVDNWWTNLHGALCPVFLVREWLRVFPSDRFLFVSAEAFTRAPEEHVHDVLRFLGWHPHRCADDS